MLQNKPQTWARLRRIELRDLANTVGNEALAHLPQWPSSGEGRAVKERTEIITRRMDGPQQLRDLNLAFGHLLETTRDFTAILHNDFFKTVLASKMYKNRDGQSIALSSRVEELVNDVENYVADYRASLPPPPTPSQLAVQQVEKIIPDQKIGPVRFEISDGVLKISHQPAIAGRGDDKNAESARRELVARAGEVIELLEKGNQDPRLIELTLDLKARLESKQDIIQLGIASITFQLACDGSREEMASVIHAKLQGLALSVGMYVAQFSEWAKFAENAAMADFNPGDVTKLFQTGSKLVDELRDAVSSVDPEVPKTLAFLLEAIRDPKRAAKRTVFAAVRTMENLVAVVMKSCGMVIGGVPEGLRSGVKIAASTLLLYAAAQTAIAISPAAARVLQSNWLEKAGKLVLESMKEAG